MSAQDAERKNAEHIAALLFTVVGGVFWITTALVGSQISLTTSPAAAFVDIAGKMGAFAPLVYTLAVLVIGYFQERIAALILALGAIGTIVWGFVAGWETNVWTIMLVFFVAPTIIAMVLFWLAGGKTSEGAVGAAA
jgi:hypothetical protein